MRRYFTKKEKQTTGLIQNLDPYKNHADHIEPYKAGGETDIANMQLISPEMNRKKSNNRIELRTWQKLFIKNWNSRKEGRPFLLVCIPGGGKTLAALYAAHEWMRAGTDRRLIIAVPSKILQRQWRDEAAHNFGLQLQTEDFYGRYGPGKVGAVITYALVCKNDLNFRGACSNNETMIILDEPHHCGVDNPYGFGLGTAFDIGKEILSLSGTPWRSDRTEIKYAKYNREGYCIADYRYDYPEALEDGVIRYLVFEYHGGTIINEITDVELAVNKDEEVQEGVLKRLLTSDMSFCRRMIAESNRKLKELRSLVSDAAALAICVDQKHAKKIAEIIEQETGTYPSVIVSDESISNDNIKDFARSQKPWLVSVRMVSEGVDIPRLQVECYLTNILTEMYFRQAIGRASRVRGGDNDEGYIYLPAHPNLVQFASNVENYQVLALEEPKESVETEPGPAGPGSPPDISEKWRTQHDGINVGYISNKEYEFEIYMKTKKIAEEVGIPYKKVEMVRQKLEAEKIHDTETIPIYGGISLEEKEKKEKKDINRLANVYVKKKRRLDSIPDIDKEGYGEMMRDLHNQLNKPIGVNTDDMSLDQLKQKKATLIKKINEL